MVGVGCDVMSWFCVWVWCFVFSNNLVEVVVIFFVFYCCNFSFEVYYKFLKIMNMLWIVYWYSYDNLCLFEMLKNLKDFIF